MSTGWVLLNKEIKKYMCLDESRGENFWSHWLNKAYVFDSYEDIYEQHRNVSAYEFVEVELEDEWYVSNKNLMTGRLFWEKENTPNACSPSSESYWCA